MKMTVTGSYKKFDRQVRIAKRIPRQGERWAHRNAEAVAETYKDNLANQGRPGGLRPELAESTVERYERYGGPDGTAIYNHVRVVDESSRNRALVSMEIPDEGGEPGQPSPAALARIHDRGTTIRTEDGGHIVIPGRRAWEVTLATVIPQAKQELKSILRPKRQ